jgi:hypothetical protein
MTQKSPNRILSLCLLFSIFIEAACESSSTNKRSNPPPQGGASSVGNGNNNPLGNTPSKVKLDSPQDLAKKTEVKTFHTLVRDGDIGYSGYCVASQKKPDAPDDGIEQLEIKEGPCPASLKINGKSSPMVYACPVRADVSGSKQQTFLYETMNTDLGFKKLSEVEFDIVRVFCGDNAN